MPHFLPILCIIGQESSYACNYTTKGCLDYGCHSDQEEQLWVWQYEAEDGTHDMFMDIDEEVRFRVAEEVFVDTLPTNSKNTKERKEG